MSCFHRLKALHKTLSDITPKQVQILLTFTNKRWLNQNLKMNVNAKN